MQHSSTTINTMKKLKVLTIVLLSAIGTVNAQYIKIHDFAGADGIAPNGTLIVIGNKLFGMTSNGGADSNGCIFSINKDGSGYKDILDFDSANGSTPYGSLLFSGGVLYGMTSAGGSLNKGVLFSVDTDGTSYTDLLDFGTGNAHGTNPYGSLIVSGNLLFGMTKYGGTNGSGCIFSILTNGGAFKEVYSFTAASGNTPQGSLLLSGNVLYGLTYYGGAHGYGTIFSVDTNGTGFKDMFDFNVVNGMYPEGSLILSGNLLFGMTSDGGTHAAGLIFSIDTNGNFYKDLHDFSAAGAYPWGSLVLYGASTLVGLSRQGGTNGFGTIFSIDTTGSGFNTEYSFTFLPDGQTPLGDLVLSGNTFYGMTSAGGTSKDGTIFSFKNVALGTKQLSNNYTGIKIFPNPSNGLFNVVINGEKQSQSKIEIYNMIGDKVYAATLSILNYQFSIDVPSGIYLYRVISETGNIVSTGKLIIDK